MKKIFLLCFLSGLLIIMIVYVVSSSIKKTTGVASGNANYGKRIVNGVKFVRGNVVGVNQKDRIVRVLIQGSMTEDIFVPKDTVFFLKLSSDLGGDTKKYMGDYLNKLEVNNHVDIELSGDTVFAQKLLVYDLKNFPY